MASLPAGRARAAPRQVAILNAAADTHAGARAALRLRRALARADQLSPLPPGDLSRALESAMAAVAPFEQALADAESELERARQAMARFEDAQARRALARAETVLLRLEPDERVVALLTDVSFQAGLVHLRDQNRGLAVDAFRLAQRLSPSMDTLDPARYPPDVISAFVAARKQAGATAVLEVSTTFDGVPVYLDGVQIGITPLTATMAPGSHYLVVAAPEFAPEGSRIDAAPRDRIGLVLELEPLPLARRAIQVRRELATASGARQDSLRAAGRAVAILAGVDAVLVIGDGATGPATAVYERAADRLSLFRPVDRHVPRLFGLLLPAPPPGPNDLLLDPRQIEPRPWYLEPWGVASIGGGTLVTILGALILTSGTPSEPSGRELDGVGFPQ